MPSVIVVNEVEVYPEALDAELMMAEKLRTLYISQPGAQSVRLARHFDKATTFFLLIEWDSSASAEKATMAWADSEVFADALSVLSTTPSRQVFNISSELGNTLKHLLPGTIVVAASVMAGPGMSKDELAKLEQLSNSLATRPGFLGSLCLDDAAVEEHVALLNYWSDYPSYRANAADYGAKKITELELVL